MCFVCVVCERVDSDSDSDSVGDVFASGCARDKSRESIVSQRPHRGETHSREGLKHIHSL